MLRLKLIDSRGIDVPVEGVAIIAPGGSADFLEGYIATLIEKGYLRAASGVSGDREGYFDCRSPVYELTENGRKVLEVYDRQKQKEAGKPVDPNYGLTETRGLFKGEEEL